MKKKFYSLMLVLTFLITLSVKVEARTEYATLPRFDVTLNGQKVDNTYAEYPLLVYKDITYFPMTYHTSRFLGVETNWSEATGLKINKTGIAGKFEFYQTKVKNNDRYQVSVPEFAIAVNGKSINNRTEQYPLLTFRDVTYFPMTWRFGVDEFDWDYDFSHQKGLVINSKKAEITKSDIKIEGKKSKFEDYSKTEFYNGNYYVVKTDGTSYRLFKDSLIGNKSEQVSDMEIKSFIREGNKLLFSSVDGYYSYDLEKGRISKESSIINKNISAATAINLGNTTFYVESKDGTVLTEKGEKVNNGAAYMSSTKVGDYTIIRFASKANSDKSQIYDRTGRMVYNTDKEIADVKMEGYQLNFTIKNANGTDSQRISIR